MFCFGVDNVFRKQEKWQSINNEELNPNITCDQQIVELMKIYRHDWLNHLQVILGYVSLKKTDQITAYVNKINQEAKQRSIISNLKNVDIAAFLYMLPIRYPCLKVELEVDEHIRLTQQEIEGNSFIHTLKSFIELFNSSINDNEVGSGTLILAIVDTEQGLNITFEYEGEVTQILKENILSIGNACDSSYVSFELILASDAELVMDLVFPLT